MAEQKSFIEPTWGTGDTVMINGKQGTIKLFSTTSNKVQVVYRDAIEGGDYTRWHDINELPKFESPQAEYPVDPEFYAGYEVASYGGTGPKLKVISKNEDSTYACEVTLTSGKTVTAEKTAEQIEKWGKPMKQTNQPAPVEEPEEEIYFDKGHSRTGDGGRLVVQEPSVRGKYMCRIHVSGGGTFTAEKTWQEIRDWGDVVDAPSTEEQAQKVLEVVKQKLAEEVPGEAVEDPSVDESETEGEDIRPEEIRRKREIKCEQFIVRDADGFHMEEASKKLTEFVNDGWQLQHIEHQTMWIPARSATAQSYVETVVYWTLTKVSTI